MSENKNKLFIIDGTAMAYRAHFGMINNPLINSRGLDTSAVFGFTNTLMNILRSEKPAAIVSIFDTPGPNFRHEIFSDYKANRDKMPQELADQFPLIKKVLSVLNIAICEKKGFEADDIMGTLARRAEADDFEVYLVTSDKDMMQVVSDKVKMYSFGRGKTAGQIIIRGPNEVEEKMGVLPEKIIDLLGLMGDTSDNVPGVPGVGPKTAVKLLTEFGSFDNIYDSLEKISRKNLQDKLRNNKEIAFLSKELVTLDVDVELDITLDQLKCQPLDAEKTRELFKDLEFSGLLRRLPELERKPGIEDKTERNYITITSISQLDEFVQKLSNQKMFAVDTETTSVNPHTALLVGLSFSWEEGKAYYIPVRVPEPDRKGDLLNGASDLFTDEADSIEKLVIEKLKPVLQNPHIKKCGQNIKYDLLVLRNCGVELTGIDFDTMIAAYLINPSSRRLAIGNLAEEYLGMTKIETKTIIGSGMKQVTMDQVALETVAEYACEDADAAFRLRLALEPQLIDLGMKELFQDVEMPLIGVLADMEETGVSIDKDMLAEMSVSIQAKLDNLVAEIYDIAGEEFNINSPRQLGVILYEKLEVHKEAGWKRVKKTKTGYATDVKILEGLSIHPLPRKVLEYRKYKKLQSTYVEALPKLINEKTGRVHTSFNQAVTATGRLSTSDPNLQNIPIRTDLGREIRKAFIAGQAGWKILSADYSQVELRVMAHVSGDETLINSFNNNEDVHKRTAAEVFGIDPEDVNDDQRRMAKTINFGVMYGMGAFGLAGRLHISNLEAQDFIDAYFKRYPGVNQFIIDIISSATRDGFVKTMFGRKRNLPELANANRNVRNFGERTAVNTPIQGAAADIIKIAMLHIATRLKKEGWQAKMILQIHDELLFEAPVEELVELEKMVGVEMEKAAKLNVPLKVDSGSGNNWFEAH